MGACCVRRAFVFSSTKSISLSSGVRAVVMNSDDLGLNIFAMPVDIDSSQPCALISIDDTRPTQARLSLPSPKTVV